VLLVLLLILMLMLLNGRKLFTIMGVCKQNYVYDALSRLISDLLFQAIPLMGCSWMGSGATQALFKL